MVFIELSEEMYRDGCLNITNMDISEVVLEKMHQIDLTMDATRVNFRDSSFDICFDKGTYDALAVSLVYS